MSGDTQKIDKYATKGQSALCGEQTTAYEIFSALVNKVRTQAKNMNGTTSRGSKIVIDPTLPDFETLKPIRRISNSQTFNLPVWIRAQWSNSPSETRTLLYRSGRTESWT